MNYDTEMISKYYKEHIEERKFYIMTINSDGEVVEGLINTRRAKVNAYIVTECDFNIDLGYIMINKINQLRKGIIIADTKEIAEELFKEAIEKGLIIVCNRLKNDRWSNLPINLDEKYRPLVRDGVIEDIGGYFKIKKEEDIK